MNIKIRNLPEVVAAFSELQENIGPAIEKGTQNAVLYILSVMPDYPPAPPFSWYKRTLTLYRSITQIQGRHPDALSRTEKASFGIVRGYVGTKLKYAPEVIGRDTQIETHARNGWWLLEDVVEREEGALDIHYEKSIDELLTKLRFK